MPTHDTPTDGLPRGTYDLFTEDWQFVASCLPDLSFTT